MILGFDIGNTSTTAGVYREDRTAPERVFRFPTMKQAGPEELAGQVLERPGRRRGPQRNRAGFFKRGAGDEPVVLRHGRARVWYQRV